jgi:hypothetical protein
MNTQHTPGPWHMGMGNGDGSVFAESGRTRLENGGTTLYPIAQVNGGWRTTEDEANARLIAAAPEMFELLYTVLPYIEMLELDQTYKPKTVAALTRRIRDTLDRAEGVQS